MMINEGQLLWGLLWGRLLVFWERLNHSNKSISAGPVWKIPSERGAWPGWSRQGQDTKPLNSQRPFSPAQFSSTMWTWRRKYKTNGVTTAAAVCCLVPFIQDVQGTGQQCTNLQLAPSLLKKKVTVGTIFSAEERLIMDLISFDETFNKILVHLFSCVRNNILNTAAAQQHHPPTHTHIWKEKRSTKT